MASQELKVDEFSSEICLDLVVGDRRIALAKVGPGYAVVRELTEINAGQDAILIMTIDGREHRWEVTLAHGIVPFDEKFEYEINSFPQHVSLF